MVSAHRARLDTTSPNLNPVHIALLDSFMAATTASLESKFGEPLRLALGAYTKYGLDQPVECFDRHTVCSIAVELMPGACF